MSGCMVVVVSEVSEVRSWAADAAANYRLQAPAGSRGLSSKSLCLRRPQISWAC